MRGLSLHLSISFLFGKASLSVSVHFLEGKKRSCIGGRTSKKHHKDPHYNFWHHPCNPPMAQHSKPKTLSSMQPMHDSQTTNHLTKKPTNLEPKQRPKTPTLSCLLPTIVHTPITSARDPHLQYEPELEDQHEHWVTNVSWSYSHPSWQIRNIITLRFIFGHNQLLEVRFGPLHLSPYL